VIVVLLWVALFISGCVTTIYPVKVYQEGSGNVMEGQFAHDWSGSGKVKFTHFDGERFTGDYTSVSPQVYYSTLTGVVGVAGQNNFATVVPSVGSSSTNVYYGVTSLAGDRGTSATCKYIGNLTGLFSFNATGVCLDTKGRKYTMHLSSDGGAQFPNDMKEKTESESTRHGE
jgi:hypothetical protein